MTLSLFWLGDANIKQKINLEIVKGKFVKEGFNRFIANVELNGELVECYVPSSSKLEKYVNLNGKTVLLSKNKIPRRTQYTLFAVPYYNKYILLNLNLINSLLKRYLENIGEAKDVKLEAKYMNYKSDLLYTDNNGNLNIVEVKGIITKNRQSFFPGIKSDRAIEQLLKIKKLLRNGNAVKYYIISLSPITKSITLNNEMKDFQSIFVDCFNNGLEVFTYKIVYSVEDSSVEFVPISLNGLGLI